MWQMNGQCLLTTTCIIDSMPNFTRGAIALEGNLPFGADFYYGIKKTLITSLSDFTLFFIHSEESSDANSELSSYLRKTMTKLCIKILVEADSAIEISVS